MVHLCDADLYRTKLADTCTVLLLKRDAKEHLLEDFVATHKFPEEDRAVLRARTANHDAVRQWSPYLDKEKKLGGEGCSACQSCGPQHES